VQFNEIRNVGAPAALAARYEAQGADEIVFLSIAARGEQRENMLEVIRSAADRLFSPLTVGGGVSSVEDVGLMLRAGADKVSINSAAVRNPFVITDSAERFGSQCIVASIDARNDGGSWRVYTSGGRQREELDAVEWAVTCEKLGAGEILLTSIDRDGTRRGYDIELTRAIAETVSIPVVASGGGGAPRDIVDVLTIGRADAALVAGALHDGSMTIDDIKLAMSTAGIRVRSAA
jgi:cyclase